MKSRAEVKSEKPPARFFRTGSGPLSMSRTAGFMVAEPPPQRHLGVDMDALASWLDSQPAGP